MKTKENNTIINGANVSVNATSVASVELVNLDLLSGLTADSVVVDGVDVDVKTLRSDILRRYETLAFGSFAEWSISDEGLAYRAKAETLSKDAKKIAKVLVDAYAKLKEAHETAEKKRVKTFSPGDMVNYIANHYDKEFKAVVGCSVRDVEGVDVSADGLLTVGRLCSWSLVLNRFTKADELVATVLTKEQMENASNVLSALFSYKYRVPRLADETAKETAKVVRLHASLNDGAAKAFALGVSLSDYLEKCKESYFAAIESAKKATIDADTIKNNVIRLRGLLSEVDTKLEKAIKDKRTAAVKKLSSEVVLYERQIGDALRTLGAAGFDTTELKSDVNKETADK